VRDPLVSMVYRAEADAFGGGCMKLSTSPEDVANEESRTEARRNLSCARVSLSALARASPSGLHPTTQISIATEDPISTHFENPYQLHDPKQTCLPRRRSSVP